MKYSDERREAVLAKLLLPNNQTVAEVVETEGVSTATLYNWRRQAREAGRLLPDQADTPDGWRSANKFNAVVETAALSETEVAEHCRARSLYPGTGGPVASKPVPTKVRTGRKRRKRSKQLERDLKRKDSALAETAALLTLRKKAEAIWGTRSYDQCSESPRRRDTGQRLPPGAGARLRAACYELSIGLNTYERSSSIDVRKRKMDISGRDNVVKS